MKIFENFRWRKQKDFVFLFVTFISVSCFLMFFLHICADFTFLLFCSPFPTFHISSCLYNDLLLSHTSFPFLFYDPITFSSLLFSYFLPLVFHLLPLTSRYLPFTFHFLTVTSYFLLIFCVTILRNQASLSRPIQYTATTRSPSYCT